VTESLTAGLSFLLVPADLKPFSGIILRKLWVENVLGGPMGSNTSPAVNKWIFFTSRPSVSTRSQNRSNSGSDPSNDSAGSHLPQTNQPLIIFKF
jgi:hypothetical protein